MATQPDINICAVGKLCQRTVVAIGPEESIVAAAERMRASHVGCLVVVEPHDGSDRQRAIGVLTDRDIVISVVARNADPNALKVGDVMSRYPLMVPESSSLNAALSFMQDAGVRRVIVTGAANEVVGIISVDDVLQLLAQQIGMVCGSLRNEMRTERVVRP